MLALGGLGQQVEGLAHKLAKLELQSNLGVASEVVAGQRPQPARAVAFVVTFHHRSLRRAGGVGVAVGGYRRRSSAPKAGRPPLVENRWLVGGRGLREKRHCAGRFLAGLVRKTTVRGIAAQSRPCLRSWRCNRRCRMFGHPTSKCTRPPKLRSIESGVGGEVGLSLRELC